MMFLLPIYLAEFLNGVEFIFLFLIRFFLIKNLGLEDLSSPSLRARSGVSIIYKFIYIYIIRSRLLSRFGQIWAAKKKVRGSQFFLNRYKIFISEDLDRPRGDLSKSPGINIFHLGIKI